jgi:2-polyprenyl-3-methyl-5-hydroxy-6-metoxy-1,4-benzoquinol methylase
MNDLLDQALAELAARYPLIVNGVVDPQRTEEQLVRQSQQILADFMADKEPSALTVGLDAFAKISFDFLRLQSRFLKSGRYKRDDAEALIRDLYRNSEKMEGYYLDGLFLTYAFWPNHAQILRFYQESFLAAQKSDGPLLEVGIGHGLMALLTLRNLAGITLTGLDVSPAALVYAQRLLSRHGISANGYSLHEVDVMNEEDMASVSTPEGGWSGAICCEVVEHVMNPRALLTRIYAMLRPGAQFFMTTVVNIEAEDHVYLFENSEQIRELTAKCGFNTEKELILTLPGFDAGPRQPLNYAAILTRPIQ